MANRILHLTSDVEVRLMPTTTGIAISIFGELDPDSHAVQPWDEMVINLVDEHSIPVLRQDDYKITQESRDFLMKIGESMKKHAEDIINRTNKHTVVPRV